MIYNKVKKLRGLSNIAVDSVYIGWKIRLIRREQGMTQREFARKLIAQILSRYENGAIDGKMII